MPKKVTKKPAKKATSTKKPVKKTLKAATKKQAKKPAKKPVARKPRKKMAHILPAPRKDVVVAPVVDASGVVTISPVLPDVVNS